MIQLEKNIYLHVLLDNEDKAEIKLETNKK